MPERECFDFTHNKEIENFPSLIYGHYRMRWLRRGIYLTQDLIKLGNSLVTTPKEFGVKMTIALSADLSSTFFRTCASNGQLEKFFPELYDCIGCTQDPRYHAEDVFDHTMRALDATTSLVSVSLDTKLAILFHDVGKKTTRKVVSRGE